MLLFFISLNKNKLLIENLLLVGQISIQ